MERHSTLATVHFVPIPAGTFTMGWERGAPAERPPHAVWIDAFEIAVTPATNADYARYRDAVGAPAGACYPWGDARPASPPHALPRVGATPANSFGLTDLSGVCHEWCADWFADDYYARSPERNPTGPATGSRRVSRGGAWRHADPWSPVAHRSSLPPHLRYTDYGVRLARDA